MIKRQQKLLREQIDKKIRPFAEIPKSTRPEEGWIYSIRKALNMSLRQLAKKLKVSPQAVKAMEHREKNGTITLNSLDEIAKSLDMRLVYVLIPNEGSLEEKVKNKAMDLAKEIVNRTSQSMKLEDQENTKARIMNAYIEKKNELINEMPKYLWD
ncbi:MAG TPA: mobile mystery protein A [Chitinophagaceae bacterium]